MGSCLVDFSGYCRIFWEFKMTTLAQLKEKHAREIEAFEAKQEILQNLESMPFSVDYDFVVVSNAKFYGCDEIVSFRAKWSEELNQNDVLNFVEKFKPVECYMFADGQTKGFIPEWHLTAFQNDKRNQNAVLTKICKIRIESCGDDELRIEWFAIVNGKTSAVWVNLKARKHKTKFSFNRYAVSGGYECKNERLICPTIPETEARQIKYASGSTAAPRKIVQFWIGSVSPETIIQTIL